jgi:putative Mn2+ efflux pump MntP
MDFLSIILIAVGLAADSFAVSVSNGLTVNKLSIKKSLLMASSFGFFHIAMMFAGWFAGKGIEQFVQNYGSIIAFALLSFIGIKMIIESFKNHKHKNNELNFLSIITQSFAISIDAFVIGISFAFIGIKILIPILIIGFVTFLFSILGLYIGKSIGKYFGKFAEITGGLVLIFIGIKILFFG